MRGGGTETFERFTERARQVVVLAQDEARALGHGYIGTEHLLLGLVREQEGLAARVLEAVGVTLEAVRSRIAAAGEAAPTGQIPFTPRAKKVLELGLREAVGLKHNHIGTEHILLGSVREGEGVAMRILQELGVDADRVRGETTRLLSAPTGGYEHAVDTFASVDALADAYESWLREGWEIQSITVQRRRRRAG